MQTKLGRKKNVSPTILTKKGLEPRPKKITCIIGKPKKRLKLPYPSLSSLHFFNGRSDTNNHHIYFSVLMSQQKQSLKN